MPFASPEEARANWLQGLAEQEAPLSREILAAYGQTRSELGAALQRLQRDLDQQAANGPLSARAVRKAASWRAFLDDIRSEFRTLEPAIHKVAKDALNGAANAGATKALELALGVARPDAALTIAAGWNRPDPRALRSMAADLTRQVRERIGVGGYAESASQKVADLLLAGMAAGYNPTRTARIASQAFNVPLVWALSHARTAQIYAYRRGSHEAYKANPKIVRGWVWLAACDRRCCVGCFSMHGTKHGHDEELNDHHQGRCCPMPDLAGLSAFQTIPSGEERFRQLSAEDQREVMGPRLLDAWKAGRVDFTRMSSATYEDPVYGTMRRAATLREMGISRAQPPSKWQVWDETTHGRVRQRVISAARETELDEAALHWRNSILTTEQRDALTRYTGGFFYDMNGYLRTGIANDDQTIRLVDNLNAALKNKPVQIDDVVWRGLSWPQGREHLYQGLLAKHQPGDIRHTDSFWSTTLDPKIAFSGGDMNVTFEFYGRSKYYVGRASATDYEMEAIIPPGVAYRVLEVKEVPVETLFGPKMKTVVIVEEME